MICHVALNDMDVGTTDKLFCNLCIRSGFVPHDTDDNFICISGEIIKKSKLDSSARGFDVGF